jgi:hypothetical protein
MSPSGVPIHSPAVSIPRPTTHGIDDDIGDDTETESGVAPSIAETDGVYSVHTTSDIGSVSAMTSESGTSLSSCDERSGSSESLVSFRQESTNGVDGTGVDRTDDASDSDTEVPSEGSYHTATPHLCSSVEGSSEVDDERPKIERPKIERSRVPRSASAAFFPRCVPTPTSRPAALPDRPPLSEARCTPQHSLYNSPTPLVGQTRIVPGDMRATYGIKTLPILSLYVPDLKSFPAILRHLHHPREPLLPALAGFDSVKEPINSTSQLQVRLYALSAYDLLVRLESFRGFVANLAALGMGARATWQQVEMVHQAFMRVLTYRGGIHNASLERIAIPLIEGERLPEVVFSKYDEVMLERHHRWAALRRVKAEQFGLVPAEDPDTHGYGI